MTDTALRDALETLTARYRTPDGDPVSFPRRYEDPGDKEAAGFIASSLAFGNAKAFDKTVGKILSVMGPSPYGFLLRFSPGRDGRMFLPLGHRWVKGRDIIALLSALKTALKKHGSLKALFLKGFSRTHQDVGTALARFVDRLREYRSGRGRTGHGSFFFPTPLNGSACKRMNLFLRWMVRHEDGLDMGLWPEVPASRLIAPLDTHVYRLSVYLGWTRRKTKDWKTALEITGALRGMNPEDPLKYDFALCHHGMEYCSGQGPERCPPCPLRRLCGEEKRVIRRREGRDVRPSGQRASLYG